MSLSRLCNRFVRLSDAVSMLWGLTGSRLEGLWVVFELKKEEKGREKDENILKMKDYRLMDREIPREKELSD